MLYSPGRGIWVPPARQIVPGRIILPPLPQPRRLPVTRRDIIKREREQERQECSLSVIQAFGTFQHATAGSLTTGNVTITAGSLLVAFARWTEFPFSVTISDSTFTNTWNTAVAQYNDGNSGHAIQCWYAYNCASGTNAVTITGSASITNSGLTVIEIGGALTASDPLDFHGAQASSSGSQASVTSGSVTTNQADEIIVTGSAVNAFSEAFTADSGYTIPTNATQDYVTQQYKIVSATQSGVTPAMNWSPNTSGTIIVATFKAATSAAIQDEDFGPNTFVSVPSGIVFRQPVDDSVPAGSLIGQPEEDVKLLGAIPGVLNVLQQWTFDTQDTAGALSGLPEEDFRYPPMPGISIPVLRGIDHTDEVAQTVVSSFTPDDDVYRAFMPASQSMLWSLARLGILGDEDFVVIIAAVAAVRMFAESVEPGMFTDTIEPGMIAESA